ncbi:MAG: sigma-70 family RNA polymerase sigma factor [Clostridia bacterium]|nr:sigma-70 family RNA polymerase sigma factor [Clostridia bacterium]
MPDDTLIREYAEKIYGFAYSKTGNSADAADLSQEILLNLCTCDFSGVENMNAFIHTVCRYTWSKFLRKNKPAWDAVTVSGDVSDYVDFTEHETPEDRVIERETYDRLRREVMYLSGIRREIIVLYYYDRMNASEIGKRLGLAPSTVRWHLSKIRRDLKERITMTDEIYRPKKLIIGHSGWWNSRVYAALESDILMQNICWLCRKEPLSLENISRTLGVAAVYLEDKISGLLSMDYMVEISGKYRTNFFIRDAEYEAARVRYSMEHVPFIAEEYYRVVKAALPDIRGIGFVGCDLPENELLWDILAYFLMSEVGKNDDRMIADLGLQHGSPMRPDGTKHWVRASVSNEEIMEYLADGELWTYYANSGGYGIKGMSNPSGTVRAYQFDLSMFGSYEEVGRPFFDQGAVTALCKAADLERRGTPADGVDREFFANLAGSGYIDITDGHIRMNLPYFTAEERTKLDDILERAAETADREEIYTRFTGYANYIDGFIPDYVSANERAHYRTSFSPYQAILWHLMSTGRLTKPDNLGAACTILYES